jgi:hypothetical protein
MATSTSQKSPCTTCGKVSGLFTCQGCQKDFCTRHVSEHRQELGKQMDELILDHDRFRQNLIEQTTSPQLQPMMKQIDQWEEESIDKIHRIANDVRKQLQNKLNEHTAKLTEKLTNIADELRTASEDDDFLETDLKQWMEKLNRLRKDLSNPPNIEIQQENNTVIHFIPKIIETIPSKETFERSVGNIQIRDDGQAIVRAKRNNYPTVRFSGEYSANERKQKDPFADMPKSSFNMNEFKRVYSNEDTNEKAIPYFWKKFDKENLSIWFCEYKYPKDLTQIFMTCNLISGFFQRLDELRKHAFATMCVFGENNNNTIAGIWIWPGQRLVFELSPDWKVDYESYTWIKLSPNDENTKKLVNQYFLWEGEHNDKKFNQGKIFK